MTVNAVSRRGFLKGVGTVAAATVLAERGSVLKEAWAAAAPTGKLRFGIQTPPQHVTAERPALFRESLSAPVSRRTAY